MRFPDFAFPDSKESFVSHDVVLKYLEDYALKYDLIKFIQFHQKVCSIKLMVAQEGSSNADKWEIKTVDARTARPATLEVDAVLICVGSYSKPVYPDIPGLQTFPGQVIHSHDYRDADDFRDKRVVVLGAGSSGVDIALQLCLVARQVNLCHNHSRIFTHENIPERLNEETGIKHIDASVITFTSGKSCQADVILLCTGYHIISKDLLDPEIGLTVVDGRFTTLYRHLIHVHHPSLAILGVLKMVVPFPLFHQQVLYLLSVWKGLTNLPTLQTMFEENEAEFRKRMERGWPVRYAHSAAGGLQWQLIREMEEESGIAPLPRYYSDLYEFVSLKRAENPAEYKNLQFLIIDNENFKVVT